jgi:hypothetical protein
MSKTATTKLKPALTGRWASLICLVVIVISLGCSKNDKKCKTLSAANGDFAACHWLVSEADGLCQAKGYDLFWGKITSTDTCDGSENIHISELTCCP